MTVQTTVRKAGPTPGNALATVFPFSFKVFAATDLLVTLTTLATGASSVLTLNDALGYTVALNADQNANPGGSITYNPGGVPLPATQTLTISSIVPQEQGTHIINGGAFFANNVEDAVDKDLIVAQDLAVKVAAALQLPVNDPTLVTTLPAAAQRANTALGFDSAGNVALLNKNTNVATFSPSTWVVLNVAAMKALTGITDGVFVQTRGYFTAGDGGAATYFWNAADVSAANVWSTIASNAGGAGRWNLIHTGEIYTQQAGLKCDGVTADTAALNALFAAWPAVGMKLKIKGTPLIDSPITANVKGCFEFVGAAGTTAGSVLPTSYFIKSAACRGPAFTLANNGGGGFVLNRGGVVGQNYTLGITRVGAVATATTNAPHGWLTGDSIRMSGATQAEYNVKAVITVTGPTTYTYAVAGAPATPATGAPIARHASEGIWINDYRAAWYQPFVYNVGGIGCRVGDPAAGVVNCDEWLVEMGVFLGNGDDGFKCESNTAGLPEANLGCARMCQSNNNLGNGFSMYASSGNKLDQPDAEGNAGYGVRIGGGGAGTARAVILDGGDIEANVLGQVKIDANAFRTRYSVDSAFTVVDGGVESLPLNPGTLTASLTVQSQQAIFEGTVNNVVVCAVVNTWYNVPNSGNVHGLVYFRDNTSGNNATFSCDPGGACNALFNGIANFQVQYAGNNLQVRVTGGVTPRNIEFVLLKSGSG